MNEDNLLIKLGYLATIRVVLNGTEFYWTMVMMNGDVIRENFRIKMRQKYIWATMEIDSLFELHTYLWVGAATLNFCYRTQVMCAFLGVIMS